MRTGGWGKHISIIEPRHSFKNFVWRGTTLYLNHALPFSKRKPPLAFAAHSFFEFPPPKKSEWKRAARREGGTRGTPRVAGFSIGTQSERTWRSQATTHAERAKSGILFEMGSNFLIQ